ncbi:MAG: mechanosensitive ion channel family protein [Thermoanaerobaculia bacterium]|nr:mechanosensitive ion channel family protein [Thermoanaerobaculia bacterium]
MEPFDLWGAANQPWAFLLTASAVVAGLSVIHFLLERRRSRRRGVGNFGNQLVMLGLTLLGLILVIMALPVSTGLRSQVLQLMGIVLSAGVAISSTTFLGNAMGGILLRAVRSFRTGDFVSVGNSFGRVSERGLFHTEIQTEDRDLTTLPNLYLVANPVKVVRASGTVVSATVSLGYDVGHARIERLLLRAAAKAGLEDPFVQICELGDFSVTYRAAGLLTDVKQLLTTRSNLRAAMLDELHGDGVEIVSPNFMNTRALSPDSPVMPRRPAMARQKLERAPEEVVFDKAEEAEERERREGLLEPAKEEEAHQVRDGSEGERSPEPDPDPAAG